MSQTRKSSLAEAITNVVVGYIVAITAQVYLFPLVGIRVPLSTNLLIGCMFTVVSLLRSYLLRRAFNWLQNL